MNEPPKAADSAQPDPELAARLRASSEQRIAEQIAAAKERFDQKRTTREDFARNRQHGLRHRLAAREARLRLTDTHNQENQ